jgi:hypothetical protein
MCCRITLLKTCTKFFCLIILQQFWYSMNINKAVHLHTNMKPLTVVDSCHNERREHNVFPYKGYMFPTWWLFKGIFWKPQSGFQMYKEPFQNWNSANMYVSSQNMKLRISAEEGNNKLQQEVCSSWHLNVNLCQKMQQHYCIHTVILQSSVAYLSFQNFSSYWGLTFLMRFVLTCNNAACAEIFSTNLRLIIV